MAGEKEEMTIDQYLIIPVVSVIFACGVLFQKVNHHDKRLDEGSKKLNEHTKAVASMTSSVETLTRDVQEIKSDVKQILRNGKCQ